MHSLHYYELISLVPTTQLDATEMGVEAEDEAMVEIATVVVVEVEETMKDVHMEY